VKRKCPVAAVVIGVTLLGFGLAGCANSAPVSAANRRIEREIFSVEFPSGWREVAPPKELEAVWGKPSTEFERIVGQPSGLVATYVGSAFGPPPIHASAKGYDCQVKLFPAVPGLAKTLGETSAENYPPGVLQKEALSNRSGDRTGFGSTRVLKMGSSYQAMRLFCYEENDYVCVVTVNAWDRDAAAAERKLAAMDDGFDAIVSSIRIKDFIARARADMK
jgi:hypothetical protein